MLQNQFKAIVVFPDNYIRAERICKQKRIPFLSYYFKYDNVEVDDSADDTPASATFTVWDSLGSEESIVIDANLMNTPSVKYLLNELESNKDIYLATITPKNQGMIIHSELL